MIDRLLIALLLFAAAFVAVLLLERLVHRGLQTVFLLLSGHMETATTLYSIVLFPGVALHELSHVLMAVLLGVKVRGFSLRPQRQPSGVIRLGYVEVQRTGSVRTSLIGAAPLFAGMIALLVIGTGALNLSGMTDAINTEDPLGFMRALAGIFGAPDAALYIYGIFTVANGMMPSRSDTQAWPPVIAALAVLTAVVGLLGGESLLFWIAPLASTGLRWLTAAFALTAFVNVIVIVAMFILARVLERTTGRRVTFHR
jgi:hypothetical protein